MQGRLRNERLTVKVRAECAHCGSPITLTIDSDLNHSTGDDRCDPIIFIPDVDLLNLKEKNIIDAF